MSFIKIKKKKYSNNVERNVEVNEKKMKVGFKWRIKKNDE